MKKYLFISVAALMMTGLLNAQSQYKAGDIASDFNLKNVKGEPVSLTDIKDADGFIVAFWCNTCPVVKKSLPTKKRITASSIWRFICRVSVKIVWSCW